MAKSEARLQPKVSNHALQRIFRTEYLISFTFCYIHLLKTFSLWCIPPVQSLLSHPNAVFYFCVF